MLARLIQAVTGLWRNEAPDVLAFDQGFTPVEAGDVLLVCGSRVVEGGPGDPIRFYAYYQNRRDQPTRLSIVFAPADVPEIRIDVPVGGGEVGLVWQDSAIPLDAQGVLPYRIFARTDRCDGAIIRSREGYPIGWGGVDPFPPSEQSLGVADPPEPQLSPPPPSGGRWLIWAPGASVPLARERFLAAAAIMHLCVGPEHLPECLREDPGALSPWQRWALALPAILSSGPDVRIETLHTNCPARVRDVIAAWWGVTDLATARDRLENLVAGRHGELFRNVLAEVEHVDEDAARHEDPQVRFVWQRRAEIAPQQIRAWDIGRVVSLTCSTFTAGYMSEAEAWRWIRRAASETRAASFTSWEAWGRSFALGYDFWMAGGIQDHDPAPDVAPFLHHPQSPWVRTPWYDGPLPS